MKLRCSCGAHVLLNVLPLGPLQGFSALHFAAQFCRLACLQVLIEEYRFPVNLRSLSGQTPLHLVIHRDNTLKALPCIHYLLRKGAALNW